MKLLITGFIQVFFVSANTYLIPHKIYLGVFLTAFTISFIWTYNIRKVVIGSMSERIMYSLGAALGSISGMWVMDILTKL